MKPVPAGPCLKLNAANGENGLHTGATAYLHPNRHTIAVRRSDPSRHPSPKQTMTYTTYVLYAKCYKSVNEKQKIIQEFFLVTSTLSLTTY